MFGRLVHARAALGTDAVATTIDDKLGTIGWVAPTNDGIGWRGFRLIQILEAGGMSARELVARVADVTGTVTAGAGEINSTTQLSDTNAFTQTPTLVGDVCILTNDNAVVGGAPEGEFAIIKFQDEEGDDFPVGEDCRFCPYWKGKQGSGADE